MMVLSLAIAVASLLLLMLSNVLRRHYLRQARTAAASLFRRVSWCLLLLVLGILTMAEVQFFSEPVTVTAIVGGIFIGIVEVYLLFQWVVLPVVRFVRGQSHT